MNKKKIITCAINILNFLFKSLNLMQKELCLTRIKLLTYADRLTVYEQILGGKSLAAGKFEAEIFYKLRSQSVLDMAIDYARVCS